jgi:hypothetical protein
MTGTELLDLIGKYAGVFVTTGLGAYLGSYLKRKGENLATHEDIDKLVNQVSAVTTTTKQIEATISNQTWQRERKAELQLRLIDSVNALTSQYLQRSIADIADPKHVPDLEWFSSFSATDAAVKALFDQDTYAKFKDLEVRIGPGMGIDNEHPLVASEKFVEARNAALKSMYGCVIDVGRASED